MTKHFIALALVLGLIACFTGESVAQQPGGTTTSVLTVRKLCCSKESKPAIAALGLVPGVRRVVPNHKSRTLTIIAHPDASPRSMWESIERIDLGPIRLATAEGVWTRKPTR